MKISLFYKHVTVIDYAYLCDHKGVVGDALIANVEFIGHTDEEGVVYDFSYAKKKVKEIIDRDCDHRLVIPKGLAKRDGGRASFDFKYGLADEVVSYDCPEEGVCELPFRQVNKATIAAYLEEIIMEEMPETVDAIRIQLVDEPLPEGKALFHYTHGLKEHYGNCQRLFHGHKNTVDVFINGDQDKAVEWMIARDIFHGSIHFCLWENVKNKDEILKVTGEPPIGTYQELPPVEIEYTSGQGRFWGKLPGRAVYFMETESTVENLSMHFCQMVKAQSDEGDIVEVRAYEGIAKGAISTL